MFDTKPKAIQNKCYFFDDTIVFSSFCKGMVMVKVRVMYSGIIGATLYFGTSNVHADVFHICVPISMLH